MKLMRLPVVFSLLLAGTLQAQSAQRFNAFTENRGQLVHTDQSPADEVLYTASAQGVNIYLCRNGFSYVPVEKQADGKSRAGARIDFRFRDHEPTAIEAHDAMPGTSNYYLAQCPNGITGVKAYRWILYRNVFPNIDVEFFLPEDGGFKYNFLLHPGARISDISIAILGTDALDYRPDQLQLYTSKDTLREHLPFSYVKKNDGTVNMLQCAYRLSRSESLELQYVALQDDPNTERVLDPWATFAGGNDTDDLFGVAMAPSNGVVTTGYTYSMNFPVSPGAMQDTSGGNYDVVVLRLDSSGQRIWSTYYGGAAYDGGSGIVWSDGLLLVTGNTASTDLPISANAWQPTKNVSYDAFVLRLDATGQRIWATYFGGSGGDQGISLATEPGGHFYLGGSSSSTDLPLHNLGYQTSLAGAIDAFLTKFDSTGVPYRSTYYGGGSGEDVHVIAVDDSMNVIICGGTFSAGFPVSPGAYQNFRNGSGDMYLVKFDSTGSRRFASFYGGFGIEDSWGLETDSAGNLYVAGFTSSSDFPMAGASWQNTSHGQSEIVLFRCDPAGYIQWSTYYGGSGNDYCYGMERKGDYLYITGKTASADFPVSSNAFQDSLVAQDDAYFVKFDTAGAMISGSFFGAQLSDVGNGITVDDSSMAYICGDTYSGNLPTTSGTMQPVYGGNEDGFVAKMNATQLPLGNSISTIATPQTGVQVFPNPAAGELFVHSEIEATSWELLDATGRSCGAAKISATDFLLPVSALAPGVYVLRILDTQGKAHSTRIVRN